MSPADLASMDRAAERQADMAEFLDHHPEYRRVEPSLGLPYTRAVDTDVAATFERARATTKAAP